MHIFNKFILALSMLCFNQYTDLHSMKGKKKQHRSEEPAAEEKTEVVCPICQEAVTQASAQLPCCKQSLHSKCLIEFTHSSLNGETKEVTCPLCKETLFKRSTEKLKQIVFIVTVQIDGNIIDAFFLDRKEKEFIKSEQISKRANGILNQIAEYLIDTLHFTTIKSSSHIFGRIYDESDTQVICFALTLQNNNFKPEDVSKIQIPAMRQLISLRYRIESTLSVDVD